MSPRTPWSRGRPYRPSALVGTVGTPLREVQVVGPESTWSIGELAEHAGVTVKTVRFYSDRGLLPEAARSAGGHRRYGPEALDRLHLIRSCAPRPAGPRSRPGPRSGGHPGGRRRGAAAADRLAAGRPALAGGGPPTTPGLCPEERAERLRLIGAVSVPPSTAALARFWRRWLPPRLPARLVSAIVEHAVPQLPEGPTPSQVLAFTRLHALVSAPAPAPVTASPRHTGPTGPPGRALRRSCRGVRAGITATAGTAATARG